MAHITAGDLLPIIQWNENTYGTATGDPKYYGDVAEGGGFTPTDTLNPYISWRYGGRSYDPANYVNRQLDAGFQASLEVRDVAGWTDILKYALGGTTSAPATSPYGALPSRTAAFFIRKASGSHEGRRYTGCKTDSLTVKCDQPGGIVRFEETVLASSAVGFSTVPSGTAWDPAGAAVQWTGGTKIGSTTIYPQSFSLTISNGLERVHYPGSVTGVLGSPAYTGAIIEGRREITLEMELWLEDLTYFDQSVSATATAATTVQLTLGAAVPYKLTVTGIVMREGQHDALIQDKQRQTVRLRCTEATMAAVA